MSVVVVATVVAATLLAAAGAAAVASLRRRRIAPVDPGAPPPFDRLELQVGDVVLRGAHEVWLTGALVLSEGAECVAAIFLGSSSAALPAEALVVRPGPPRAVAWVQRIAAQDWPHAPDCIELEGETLQRVAKLPVTVAAHGEIPGESCEGQAQWIAYEGPSGIVAFMLRHATSCLLWRGTWQEEGALLRLAAGSASLR